MAQQQQQQQQQRRRQQQHRRQPAAVVAAALVLLLALTAARTATAAASPLESTPPPRRRLEARGWGDPHYVGFDGAKFEVCMGARGRACQGKALSLFSDKRHQVNVELNRFKGPNAFPYVGTWMTGFGVRYRDTGGRESTVEVRLKTDAEYQLTTGASGKKALNPDGARGKFGSVIAEFRVDGRDARDRLETGHTQEAAGLRVHFPAARHAHDPTDGPLAIVTTPDLQITWYLESDDIWHLDFTASVFEGHALGAARGLIGQTLRGAAAAGKEKAGAAAKKPEGADADYFVPGGLLGADGKHGAYEGLEPARR